MIYIYLLVVCFALIILQTTLLVGGGPAAMYDLLGPFVVYLGVHRPVREAIPVLLIAGLVMDGISGGVFGVHLSTYLWLFFGIRWVIQYLHVGNVILLPLLVTVGVAFESLLTAFSAVVLASAAWPVEAIFAVVPGQVLLGALTGPFLMLLFVGGQRTVERMRKTVAADSDALRSP